MAKYYNLITVNPPSNLQAQLLPGGSLPANTTYYYRMIAVRRLTSGSYYAYAFSAPTAEVSATTDSTNRTIRLTWTYPSNYFAVFIQRTTTSGSYPVHSLTTLGYSERVLLIDTVTQYDDGATANVAWVGSPFFPSYHQPIIEVYSDANDTITHGDLANQALNSGWQFVWFGVPVAAGTTLVNKAPMTILGSLYLRNCKFNWCGIITIVNGVLLVDSTTTFVYDSYTHAIHQSMHIAVLSATSNFSSFTLPSWSSRNYGVGDLMRHSFVSVPTSSARTYYFIQYAYGGGANFIRSFINYETYGTYTGSMIDLLSPYQGTNVSNLYFSGSYRPGYTSDLIISNCMFQPPGTDVITTEFYLNNERSVFRDCSFNRSFYDIYYGLRIYDSASIGRSLLHEYSINLTLSTPSGTPISGAKVYLKNANNVTWTFVDTGVQHTNSLNNTDTTSTLTVTDGSQFAVGDVIRQECCTELMLVTAKSGNNLTVQRGYLGTEKRRLVSSGINRRILKQVPYLTTDSNGKVTALCYYAEIVSKNLTSGGYSESKTLSQFITEDKVYVLTFSPYTIRIEADGYQTYQDVITVDKTLNLEIALSIGSTGGGGAGKRVWPRLPI